MGALSDFQGTSVDLRYLGSLAELDGDEVMGVQVATGNLEVSLVGVGLGGRFANTDELKVINYKEAMKSKYGEAWNEEVVNEDSFDEDNLSGDDDSHYRDS